MLIRAHLCTLAIAVSFNSVWRAPMDSFRYGGLQFLLVQSVAMIFVALPVTLLQLAIGQLSQQDAVGMWRAVPFFKGKICVMGCTGLIKGFNNILSYGIVHNTTSKTKNKKKNIRHTF